MLINVLRPFNLSVVSVMKRQWMKPVVMAVIYSETNPISITLEATNTTSYDIVGKEAYSWLSINTSTGEITIQLTDAYTLGHKFFDITLSDGTRTTTISSGLRISLVPDEVIYDDRLATLTTEVLPTITSTSDGITNTRPFFFPKIDGSLCACLSLFPKYSVQVQAYIVDLIDGLTKNVDDTSFVGDFIHNAEYIYIGDGKSILLTFNGGFVRYHIYDTVTNTWDIDFIPKDTVLQASQASTGYRICQGTDGKVFVVASSDGTTTACAIREIDATAKTSVLYSNIAIGMGEISADDTHVYVNEDFYGAGKVFAVTREVAGSASPTITTIQASVISKGYQRKEGAVYQNNSTADWYFLYAGAETLVSTIPQVPPWGGDAIDPADATLYNDIPANTPQPAANAEDADDWDTINLPYGHFWWRYDGDSTYNKIVITGINKYATILERISKIEDKIVATKDGYLGYMVYDTTLDTTVEVQPVDGRYSLYVLAKRGLKMLMGGYFDGGTIEHDTTNLVVDNTTSAVYNPNTPATYVNSRNLGMIGNTVNISKTYGMSVASNGDLYFGGIKIRSGEGGGLAYYNFDTEVVTQVAGFTSYEVWNVVTVGNYVIASSIGDAIPSPLRYSVVDITTNTVVQSLEPDALVTLNHGRITTDGVFIYGMTTDDANTETYLYKMDIVTGALVKSRTYDFNSIIGGSNDSGVCSFDYHSDDFIYATFGLSAREFVRIDTTTLGAEPIGKLPINSGRFAANTTDTYFLNDVNIQKRANTPIVDGFIDITPAQLFDYISAVSAGTGGITVNYIDTDQGVQLIGDGTPGASAYLPNVSSIFTEATTDLVNFEFTLTVASGSVEIQGGEWLSAAEGWLGAIGGMNGVYTSAGSPYTVQATAFSNVAGVQYAKIQFDGLNNPTFDCSIEGISVIAT